MTKLLRRAAHYAVHLVAGVLILLSLLALVLRLWIMPDIDRHRPELERLIGEATGLRVSIDALHAGWRGISPHLRLDNVRFAQESELPSLTLPRVEATVSWASLLLAELRLASLEIDRPHLVVRRDAKRVIYVAGIPVNTPGARSAFPDWLLEQHRMVVKQGTVVWQDDLLGAPPLTLSDLNLVLLNRFGRHRLGLRARPPEAAARWLDMRADIKGRSVARLEGFSGRVYARLEGASSEALRTWAPWAQRAVRGGVGALRFWLDFSNRRIDGVVGDVRLHHVQIGPTEDLPEIRFASISGRLGWRQDAQGQDYYIERLGFVSPQGHKAEPASVRVHLAALPGGRIGEARVEAEELRLEVLTALIGAVPIPRQAHDLIESLTPRGFVERLRLNWLDKRHYRLEARLQDVGFRPGMDLPGISGLSGEIEASEKGGRLRIRSRGLGLDYARVFRQAIAFDRVEANVDWQAGTQGGQVIRLQDARLANPDLDVSGGGSIVLRPGASPELDLQARLTRGEGRAVWRYLPWQVADDAYDWVRRGIQGGISDEARFILRGPLDRFPFDKGGGLFRVDVKIRDARVEVAPGWPPFTQVNGWLSFHDTAMELMVDSAQVEGVPGVQLYGIKGVVPDLHHSWEEILTIEGRARGATSAFLDYIRVSPAYDYTDRFTDSLRAQGNGELALRLTLPLRKIEDSKVAGVYRAVDNRLDPGKGLPVLEHLSGDLAFTLREIRAQGLTTVVLGQPANLDIASAGGRVNVTLDGRVEARSLAEWIPAALRPRIEGAASYRAEITLGQGKGDLRLSSDLKGLALRLPEPLGKPAEQAESLLVTRSETEEGGTAITVRYGQLLAARALLDRAKEPPRVSVRIGSGEPALPTTPGLTVSAVQKRLDLDRWLEFAEQGQQGAEGAALPIHEIALTANELLLSDRVFTDTHLKARPSDKGWQVQVAGREVQGELGWQRTAPFPRIEARLKRLVVPEPRPGAATAPAGRKLRLSADIVADDFVYKGMDLGALRLAAQPAAHGLRVYALSLTHPDGRLEGEGLIADHPRRASVFNLRASSTNLGRLAEHLGYPGRIRRGEGSVEGRLGWQGGLDAFSLATLSGELGIALKKGQFPKLDPGAARLLGVLSLQALPRRITLDFRDVFSEGFAFDEISTPVHLEGGIAYLADFRMRGPAASITMKGQIDLLHETQQLRLAIQPRLEDTLAAGAILINPAVGIGALVASKVLQDPLSKAATFEYLVKGSWTEPEVTRLARPKPEGADTPATAP